MQKDGFPVNTQEGNAQKQKDCTRAHFLCFEFASGIFTKVNTNSNANRPPFFCISCGIGVIGC